MLFKYLKGATPINPEEIADLMPSYVSTQEELNAWEGKNIVRAEKWAFKQKNILSLLFIRKLHRRMFDKTWLWAGAFRLTEKNLGIAWHRITVEFQKLCDDTQYHLDHKIFSLDEIAIRLHHRLAWIHPFPNGNGRHARLMADLLINLQGLECFSWGSHYDLNKQSHIRNRYIEALQRADCGDYSSLLTFVRS